MNLKNRSTKTIGVILPNILNSFFAKVFTGIEKIAEEKGYNLITCISNESIEKEVKALELLSNGTIDGFILSISQEAQKLQQFGHFKSILNEGTPIVLFDRTSDELKCDKVIVDDTDSAINATEHLIKTGCKNIALLSTICDLNVGKLRANGFYQALKNNNIELNQNLVFLTDNEIDFDEKIQSFFAENTIDAIFALDEHAAVTAMKIGIKKGLKIPDELSIIGFADGVWSRRMTPSLSTVSQHGPEIGEVAARLLIEKLENKSDENTYKTTIVKTELRQRESTKKL